MSNRTKKTRIVIAGIGGVGGYFGGMLAKKYQDSSEVEIVFVSRGEHLRQIQENGLKVLTIGAEFTAIPALASDSLHVIGIADYLLICTKSYDLESIINQLKPGIDKSTIVLPLLNGVDAIERIKALLPDTVVLSGCVYIVSRLKEAGVIENMSNIQKLFFGLEKMTSPKLKKLEKILISAGIEATLTKDINSVIWEKFVYISAIATATCYYNNCLGELLEDHLKRENLYQLIEEVSQIALVKGVITDPEIVMKTQNKLSLFPYESTSSMHSDYKNHKQQTEIETLTGYVVNEGVKMKIPTPVFEKAYKELINAPKGNF